MEFAAGLVVGIFTGAFSLASVGGLVGSAEGKAAALE
jgi:hypothetical protein